MKIRCPYCRGKGPSCIYCGGTGLIEVVDAVEPQEKNTPTLAKPLPRHFQAIFSIFPP